MGNNLDTIKILHIDKEILNKFVKEDFLEENSDVFSATIHELFTFTLKKYLGTNYPLLKSQIENEHKKKALKNDK